MKAMDMDWRIAIINVAKAALIKKKHKYPQYPVLLFLYTKYINPYTATDTAK